MFLVQGLANAAWAFATACVLDELLSALLEGRQRTRTHIHGMGIRNS